MPTSISEQLRVRAQAEGFVGVNITSPSLASASGERLRDFVAAGFHGEMAWLAETMERRSSPSTLWPEARSVVLFALNYDQGLNLNQRLARTSQGVISSYALNRDYHDLIKGKLKRLGQWFAKASGAAVKVFADTAPLMEKPLAQQAGLGWQGKHTNLVSQTYGSWLFLGGMLTTADLPYDGAAQDHCGSCRACLDICPTQAFTAPYKLDARACISYLTIEHQGVIAQRYRKAMGNRIYGCDDCLAICPWNKFATLSREVKLQARDELIAPSLEMLAGLDNAAFRALFSGSPIKRTGRDRFVRNVVIAIGNSSNRRLIPTVTALLTDASPLVRGMAVWALKQLDQTEFKVAAMKFRALESDTHVCAEWDAP